MSVEIQNTEAVSTIEETETVDQPKASKWSGTLPLKIVLAVIVIFYSFIFGTEAYYDYKISVLQAELAEEIAELEEKYPEMK